MKNNFCCLAKGGLALIVSSLLLTGCLDSSSSSSGKKTELRNLDLNFAAIDSSKGTFDDITGSICNVTLEALGTESTDATIAYMAFYVHDVKLITSTGTKIPVTLDENTTLGNQEQGIALVDFRDKTGDCSGTAIPENLQKNLVLGSYEHKEGSSYTGLEFSVGLPANINHADVNTDGILSKAVDMHWNWLAGYRFLRMDLKPEGGVMMPDASNKELWTVHLGATGCSNADANDGTDDRTAPPSSACTNTNIPTISLTDFNPANSLIAVDIAALYEGNDLTKDLGAPAGCMSGVADPECGEIFARLGLEHQQQGSQDVTTPVQQVIFSLLND